MHRLLFAFQTALIFIVLSLWLVTNMPRVLALAALPDSGNPLTEPAGPIPEETTEDCPEANVAGDQGVVPMFISFPQATPVPEMRTDAGLNFSTAVKGAHCAQAKGSQIILNESSPFEVTESPQHKVVSWSGDININNGRGVSVPFAQDLSNHLGGDWSPEFVSEDEMDQTVQLAYGDNTDEESMQKARSKIESRSGILKAILPSAKQDELKCAFINYVRTKGTKSMYANFSVDGHRLTDISCPPTVNIPAGTNTSTLDHEYSVWEDKWAKTWKKLSLFPNERTVGKIKLSVSEDKSYNTYGTYPEVFRLGLAANQLFQVLAPGQIQDNFYSQGYEDLKGNPLTSDFYLKDQPVTGANKKPLGDSKNQTSQQCDICQKAQRGTSETTGGFKGNNSLVSLGALLIDHQFDIPAWKKPLPVPDGCHEEVFETEDKPPVKSTRIVCTDEHKRGLGTYNNSDLESPWEQIASPNNGKTGGIYNIFIPGLITGSGAVSPTGCSGNTQVVFDQNGNISPNAASTDVTFDFKQKANNGVNVTQSSPQSATVLYYRLGGVCNADNWVSTTELLPQGAIRNLQ